ncbi:MAG: RNA-processing protein [Theionarchaea archaeon]|nr:MAG: RNA-processing protein [Theionarchaea archaeon DG-70-1]MBU7030542.1 RNA-processing protein [Theionarchaea archaeon]
MEEYVRVPRARIGAIIGKEGETKQKIEETLDIAIDIDTESGQTHISSRETTGDPLAVWKGRDVIKAIARGFSPEKALALIEDGMCFEIIDLEDYFGKSENSLRRVKGRIIGRNGTTRKIIENMTGVRISVYGRTVALIGEFENVQDARRALDMLMRGCMHSTVYKFLENLRRKRKMKERKSIWK